MQNFTLHVLWLDSSLGIALNQRTEKGTLPLTSYYFWPTSEAWEQIKSELESKSWVPEEERVRLLNLVVEIMNLWQGSRFHSNGPLKIKDLKLSWDNITIVGIS